MQVVQAQKKQELNKRELFPCSQIASGKLDPYDDINT